MTGDGEMAGGIFTGVGKAMGSIADDMAELQKIKNKKTYDLDELLKLSEAKKQNTLASYLNSTDNQATTEPVVEDIGEGLKQDRIKQYNDYMASLQTPGVGEEAQVVGNTTNQAELLNSAQGSPNIFRGAETKPSFIGQRLRNAGSPEERNNARKSDYSAQGTEPVFQNQQQSSYLNIPNGAIDLLRSDSSPQMVQYFENKYGLGSSKNILGQ